jgi:hypothetical protein
MLYLMSDTNATEVLNGRCYTKQKRQYSEMHTEFPVTMNSRFRLSHS